MKNQFIWDSTVVAHQQTFAVNNRTVFLSPGTVSVAAWNHLAATWDGTTWRTYLNGILGATSVQGLGWASAQQWNFGFAQTFTSPGSGADLALWSTALSAGQIAALASGYRANHVAPQNMMVYWPILGLSPEPDRSLNS